jgi:hypothetical protein
MKNIVEYEMIVHTFGAKPSPCVSTFTLRHHGKKVAHKISKEFLEAIMKNFYVDDYLDSFTSIEMARKVRTEMIGTLYSGGFILMKWKSTHAHVLENLPKEEDDWDTLEKEDKDLKIFEDSQVFEKTEKVLGVSYSFEKDVFWISVNEKWKDLVTTWRQMMKLTAYVFDPL